MSAIDKIVGYQKNPDEDFYLMLNCNEHSTVSHQLTSCVAFLKSKFGVRKRNHQKVKVLRTHYIY